MESKSRLGPLLEVCIDNVISGVKAQEGGADRIELCSALSEGGLTPSVGFMEIMKQLLDIPIFAMIRPRGGDFVYGQTEIEIMKRDIKSLASAGANGFVFGVLDDQGHVDEKACAELLKEIPNGRTATFHRAFDLAACPETALEIIIKLGFTRILTSGQAPSAQEGKELIRKLVDLANGRITIMAGAGVNPENVKEIVETTKVTEIHGSCRTKVRLNPNSTNFNQNVQMGANKDEMNIYVTDVDLVKKLIYNIQ